MGCAFLIFFLAFGLYVSNSQMSGFGWWDHSWNFRVGLEVNTSGYSRLNWPVEHDINFTKLLEDTGASGTLDTGSIRVVEYDSSGNILYEIPSQFDAAKDFDASTNAYGTVVFTLNGTNPADTVRYFFVYFDVLENGNKPPTAYGSDINYTWNGEEFTVNSTNMKWYVDTRRGENTSGIYRVQGNYNNIFTTPPTTERTLEYNQFLDGALNLSFDFRYNATFTLGPARLTVEQDGNETYWNDPANTTGYGRMVKRYYFYYNQPWVRIEEIYYNDGGSVIYRNSTRASALAFDSGRAGFVSGTETNSTEPGSWYWAGYPTGHIGIINLNETNTNNFTIDYDTESEIMGINLALTPIAPGAYIGHTAVMHFNDTNADYNLVQALQERLLSNVNVTENAPDRRRVESVSVTDHAIYNRNESILITSNISYDPYNLSQFVNVTLDLGTPGTGDDVNLTLYDDGSHGDSLPGDRVYTNVYDLANDSATGQWNADFFIYNASGFLLNQTTYPFNVTSTLFVNTSIHNPTGFTGRQVNATVIVMNWRQDTYVTGSGLNCTMESTPVDPSNITDFGNGTFLVTFASPDYNGLYTLNCSAEKDGNAGFDTDQFTSEAIVTELMVTPIPASTTLGSVTWYTNQSFILVTNISNFENGTAFNTNVTVDVPENFTINVTNQSCGTVFITSSCQKSFLVTASNGTLPGNYTLNITIYWTNSDDTVETNSSTMTANVTGNPIMNVNEAEISAIMPKGVETTIGSVTLNNTGNDFVTDIEFNITGFSSNFTFDLTPSSVASLSPGQILPVTVNLTIPADQPSGTYKGNLNVTSANSGWIYLNMTIYVSETNMSISATPDNYTAANITAYVSESFELAVNVTNLENGTGYNSTIYLDFSTVNITSNQSQFSCGNIPEYGECFRTFLATVHQKTLPGNYTLNVSVVWEDPKYGYKTNFSLVNITVLSNVIFTVNENNISSAAGHGASTKIGQFTLNSSGNDNVINVTYRVNGLPDFTFIFVPSSRPQMLGAELQTVQVNVSIPAGYDPGNFSGTLNVTTNNAGSKSLTVNITVPESRTWFMNGSYNGSTHCEHLMTPPTGYACNVTVSNTGNVPINFTVSPAGANYTSVNVTSFTLQKQATYLFSVLYDVTTAPYIFHNTTYVVNATQAGAFPDFLQLFITLNPFVAPLVSLYFAPNVTKQLGQIDIYVNVTSQSGLFIPYAMSNVTDPNNLTNMSNMSWTGQNGNTYFFHLTYPQDGTWGTWGSTLPRGNYTLKVYAGDSNDNVGYNQSSFFVYVLPLSDTRTYEGRVYYQGEQGSVYQKAYEPGNTPLQNANVTISILNPENSTFGIYMLSGYEYQTGSTGEIPPNLFLISSNATAGNYTLTSTYDYFDDYQNGINFTVTNTTSYTFEVRKSGDLNAKLEVDDVAYLGQPLSFSALVSDPVQLVDPDEIEIQVYYMTGIDPQPWFNLILSNMTREYEGFYTYSMNIPAIQSRGTYLAVMWTARGGVESWDFSSFRISSGGPYDVIINLLEPEVPPGDYLDFDLTVENKGEVEDQDVLVEFWVSSSNQTWYYTSESINVPPGNLTLPRSAFISSIQPLGLYFLNVKVTYDPTQPAATANESFYVVEAAPPGPPSPGGGGTPGAPSGPAGGGGGEDNPDIEISSYPQEIGIETGFTKYPIVQVTNTGNVKLYNVTLRVTGIPSAWIEMTPAKLPELAAGDNVTFTMKVAIPTLSEGQEYPGTLIAEGRPSSGNTTSDTKSLNLVVFTSRDQLVQWEIDRLKKAVAEFEGNVQDARKAGKDVREVLPLIDQIKEQITIAEDYLAAKRYDDALNAVTVGWTLLERARQLLASAPFIEILITTVFPPWLIAIFVVLAIVIVVLVVLLKKVRGSFNSLFRVQAPQMKKSVVVEKMQEKESNEMEKAKIQRILTLLENEHREGLISDKAYNDLKSRNEEKLRKLG